MLLPKKFDTMISINDYHSRFHGNKYSLEIRLRYIHLINTSDKGSGNTLLSVVKLQKFYEKFTVSECIKTRYKDIEKKGIYKCVDTQIISTTVNI